MAARPGAGNTGNTGNSDTRPSRLTLHRLFPVFAVFPAGVSGLKTTSCRRVLRRHLKGPHALARRRHRLSAPATSSPASAAPASPTRPATHSTVGTTEGSASATSPAPPTALPCGSPRRLGLGGLAGLPRRASSHRRVRRQAVPAGGRGASAPLLHRRVAVSQSCEFATGAMPSLWRNRPTKRRPVARRARRRAGLAASWVLGGMARWPDSRSRRGPGRDGNRTTRGQPKVI